MPISLKLKYSNGHMCYSEVYVNGKRMPCISVDISIDPNEPYPIATAKFYVDPLEIEKQKQ